MQIVIDPHGQLHCIYTEVLPLHEFGSLTIQRGSHVEPTHDGHWTADLSPVNGPLLGPFTTRSQALSAEVTWLEHHWQGGTAATDAS